MNQRAIPMNSFVQYFLKSLKGSMIGMILVPIFYMALNPSFNFSPDYLNGLWISIRIGLMVVVTNLTFVSALYYTIFSFSPELLERMRSSVRFRLGMGLIGMTLGLTLASNVEPLLGGSRMRIQVITTGLLLGGLCYLSFLLFFAFRQTKEQNLKLRAESAESSLNVLKNQMQPHFLFNSLNSLAELIDSNQTYASTMAQKLSDLYREILEASKEPKSPLVNEISIVNKYLELEALRFGARLSFSINVPPNLDQIVLPSLVLQTLVENAVKHGISNSLSGGSIAIEVKSARPDGYDFMITNTSENNTKPKPSTGTGITNTRARLDLMYGDKHKFAICFDSQFTRVSFWISGI